MAFIHHKVEPSRPLLSKLNISPCQEDCNDPEKIFSETYKDGTYKLKYGFVTNCSRSDTVYINYFNDTLTINMESKPRRSIFIVNGKPDTIYTRSRLACDCYFYVDLEVKDLTKKPINILVNNYYYDKNKGFVYIKK